MAIALSRESQSGSALGSWQNRRVVEVMHRASIRVTPDTSVASAAMLLFELNLNCLPVIQYESQGTQAGNTQTQQAAQLEKDDQISDAQSWQEGQPLLVGLLTRSNLLIALARSLGVFELGIEVNCPRLSPALSGSFYWKDTRSSRFSHPPGGYDGRENSNDFYCCLSPSLFLPEEKIPIALLFAC